MQQQAEAVAPHPGAVRSAALFRIVQEIPFLGRELHNSERGFRDLTHLQQNLGDTSNHATATSLHIL
jgi:hypothetical protein